MGKRKISRGFEARGGQNPGQIHTTYDQFGGHGSESLNTAPTTYHKRGALRYQENQAACNEIFQKLSNVFRDLTTKEQWRRDIKSCLESKVDYEKKKAQEEKLTEKTVRPEDDPVPLNTINESDSFSCLDPVRHLPFMKTVLAIFHDRMANRFNKIVTSDILAIYPRIDKVAFGARPLQYFLRFVWPDKPAAAMTTQKNKPGRSPSEDYIEFCRRLVDGWMKAKSLNPKIRKREYLEDPFAGCKEEIQKLARPWPITMEDYKTYSSAIRQRRSRAQKAEQKRG